MSFMDFDFFENTSRPFKIYPLSNRPTFTSVRQGSAMLVYWMGDHLGINRAVDILPMTPNPPGPGLSPRSVDVLDR